ncbi:DUF397 domain-containing protein [Amycolatopsis sp. NPDC059021]|uniref:DUF397 domain-containing protein n=1 Tax=Amycolatopsis sp. NPDC059021 TaxID=3346704 RepID=UPI00366F4BAD
MSHSTEKRDCVEVALSWAKSSHSTEQGDCVEVAISEAVGIRDTKDRASGHLTVSRQAWRAALRVLG